MVKCDNCVIRASQFSGAAGNRRNTGFTLIFSATAIRLRSVIQDICYSSKKSEVNLVYHLRGETFTVCANGMQTFLKVSSVLTAERDKVRSDHYSKKAAGSGEDLQMEAHFQLDISVGQFGSSLRTFSLSWKFSGFSRQI